MTRSRTLFPMLLALTLSAQSVVAQMVPPVRTLRPVVDETMVVLDRGARLEIYPAQRAVAQVEPGTGRVVHRVSPAGTTTPISAKQLGVVFNHALQQQGYISGEIAFKLKAGLRASGFPRNLYPSMKRITQPEVYVVNARSPAEFMAVLKRLQARSDLDWVEPTVTYGLAASDSHP